MRSTLFLIALAFNACLLSASVASAQPQAVPPEMLVDAELTSVQFLDADTGWAVGDRGAIWHTVDGGRTWQTQRSPVGCRLEQIFFLNHDLGWAVGGWHQAFTHLSHGVVLYTTDGGRTWHEQPGLHLPYLRGVHFTSEKQGIAFGDTNPLFPNGIQATRDGGRTWSPLPTQLGESWLAGVFASHQRGILFTPLGTGFTTNGIELQAAATPSLGARRPRAASVVGDQAWLAGDGGTVLQSGDAGKHWNAVSTLPPSLAHVDWTTVTQLNEHVWLAGDPGSLLLHSADGGATWETQATEQRLPLRGLFFLDEQRGWAVGAGGTILATRDGGRSWRVQRQGASRAPLLAIVSRPEHLPAEMLFHLAANEGYMAAAEIVTNSPRLDDSEPARSREAGRELGMGCVNTAWRFPLPRDDDTLALETLLATHPQWRQVEEYLVGRIRLWRPDVIVTEPASGASSDPVATLVNQLVLSATAKAADREAYAHQLQTNGWEPWTTRKVFAMQGPNQPGTVNLSASQLAPHVGKSLSDGADTARGQWYDHSPWSPNKCGFSLLIDHLPQGQGKRDFFSGIPLSPGTDGRRRESTPTEVSLPALARQLQKQQSLYDLLERSMKDPLRGEGWLAQVNELNKQVAPSVGSRALSLLAERYRESQEDEFAVAAWKTLVDRYPEEPLSPLALRELISHYAGSEPTWKHRASKSPASPEVARAEQVGVAQVAWSQDLSSEYLTRSAQALAWGRLLEKRSPELHAGTSLRLSLAAAARVQGDPKMADKLLNFEGLTRPEPFATASVAAEKWILQPSGPPPKPVIVCPVAQERPRLDGRLDDPAWQAAATTSLVGPATATSGLLAMTADDEFLYVACSCERVAGVNYPEPQGVRTRDAELTERDRLELCFDIDRDYATYFQLSVDHRGWTHDACGQNAAWNPQWFVARGGDERYWTAEFAIAWSELGIVKPQPKQFCALRLRRLVAPDKSSTTLPRPDDFVLVSFASEN